MWHYAHAGLVKPPSLLPIPCMYYRRFWKFKCGTVGLSTTAEGKDQVENGASCDVEFACGFVVWPVVRASGGKGEVKEEGKSE